MAERGESSNLWMPILISLRGSDVANLYITDVDLSQCRFAGARFSTNCASKAAAFSTIPPTGFTRGWAWPPAWRWSHRQSIAEERTWRGTTRKQGGWGLTPSVCDLPRSARNG